MTNYLKTILISLLGATFTSESALCGPSQRLSMGHQKPISYYDQQESLYPVLKRCLKAIKHEHIDPSEITIVLDVDGTITNYSDPGKISLNRTFGPRRRADKAIKTMIHNLNVQVVVSSAWNKFDETCNRLNLLGLGPILGLDNFQNRHQGIQNINGKEYHYYQWGHVISVRDLSQGSRDPYFRAKHIAPYIMDKTQAANSKVVVFADDSPKNIQIFQRGVSTDAQLYPQAIDICLVQLTGIEGGEIRSIKPAVKESLLKQPSKNVWQSVRKAAQTPAIINEQLRKYLRQKENNYNLSNLSPQPTQDINDLIRKKYPEMTRKVHWGSNFSGTKRVHIRSDKGGVYDMIIEPTVWEKLGKFD